MTNEMYTFAQKLWPYHRSLAGNENRHTLKDIQKHLPDIKILEFESNKPVFDWVIPEEWVVKKAFIITPSGEKICDVSLNNLHLVSYSIPFHGKMNLEQLSKHIYFLKDQPNAIPYITSYYNRMWGFCITYNQFKKLKKGEYQVVVDTKFVKGSISIGELTLPGMSKKEVLFSTYICHPSMANNELSGIVVQTFLAKWLKTKNNNYYSYRFLFLPETIGSITYINRNIKSLKKNVKFGFVLTCIGDQRGYSILNNKDKFSYSSRIGKYTLSKFDKDFKEYDWRERGSDERQYSSPNVGLDISVLMRTKFGEYPEYHTSLDKLGSVVTENGLKSSLKMVKKLIQHIEADKIIKNKITCEPMLSKHNLYPHVSTKSTINKIKNIRDIIDNADGSCSLLSLCEKYNLDILEIEKIALELKKKKIIELGPVI